MFLQKREREFKISPDLLCPLLHLGAVYAPVFCKKMFVVVWRWKRFQLNHFGISGKRNPQVVVNAPVKQAHSYPRRWQGVTFPTPRTRHSERKGILNDHSPKEGLQRLCLHHFQYFCKFQHAIQNPSNYDTASKSWAMGRLSIEN